MCGIFGYYNFNCPRDRQFILDALLRGLRRLEYRGYDSAGICIDGDSPLPPKALSVHNGVQLDSPMKVIDSSGVITSVEAALPLVIKAVGKIDELSAAVKAEVSTNNVRPTPPSGTLFLLSSWSFGDFDSRGGGIDTVARYWPVWRAFVH
jgi:glutamate synthase domain-containing protein 1